MLICRKPDANWGSSADAQTFVTAMQKTQELTNNPEHIKNYRPKVLMLLLMFIFSLTLSYPIFSFSKVLVLTGNPAHRPSLVDFANIITKKLSLLICGHVMTEVGCSSEIMQ